MTKQTTTTIHLSKEQLKILSSVFVHWANPMQPKSVWIWDEAEKIEMEEYKAIRDGLLKTVEEN
tara:strand:- start:1982 stop:2173 length:192 start_codon:yes stop_codon:yes gene_type:complete